MHSHIAIDLSQKKVAQALAVLQQKKGRKKIESALLYASRRSHDGIKRVTTAQRVKELFVPATETLIQMPNLRKLELKFNELDHFVSLSMSAMTKILASPSSRLKELAFENVRFSGTPKEMMSLAKAIQNHSSLKKVCLTKCNGEEGASLDPIIRALSMVPTMRELELSETTIDSNHGSGELSEWDGESLASLCQSPSQLKILALKDIPDIQDNHIQMLADSMANYKKSKLETLSISSPALGDEAALALFQVLSAPPNKKQKNQPLAFHTLWLDFEIDLNACSPAIARALETNGTLQRLYLRLSGGDVDSIESSFGRVVHSLRSNTSLRRLKLSLVDLCDIYSIPNNTIGSDELDDNNTSYYSSDDNSSDDGERDDKYTEKNAPVLISLLFEDLLQRYNHTLESIQINDGIYGMKFQTLDLYLKLNSLGLRALLQNANATKDEYVQVMSRLVGDEGETASGESSDENSQGQLDMLFYILSRNPTLCCDTFSPNHLEHLEPEETQDTPVTKAKTGKTKRRRRYYKKKLLSVLKVW